MVNEKVLNRPDIIKYLIEFREKYTRICIALLLLVLTIMDVKSTSQQVIPVADGIINS